MLIDPSAKVTAGADYSLTLQDATPALPQPEMLPLDILYEDEDLIAVNKAAGMVVHPAPGQRRHIGQCAAVSLRGKPDRYWRGRKARHRPQAG